LAHQTALMYRAVGAKLFNGPSWTYAAWASMRRGDFDRAKELLAEGASDVHDVPFSMAVVLTGEALLARAVGDLSGAEAAARRSLVVGGTSFATAEAFEILGGTLGRLGDHEEAARTLGAADRLREETGLVRRVSDE